jgi:hypothetical protein
LYRKIPALTGQVHHQVTKHDDAGRNSQHKDQGNTFMMGDPAPAGKKAVYFLSGGG